MAPPRSRLRSVGPVLLLVSLGACEFPTEAPLLEQTWVIPTDSTSVAVNDLLPAGFSVVGGAFAYTPTPVTVSQNLVGTMCSTCTSSATAQPKPAFTATMGANISTGTDILQANLATGNVFRVNLAHNFTFDPIRPSATARGFIVIVLTRAGVVIGRDSISGNSQAWLAGQALQRDIPLTAGASIASGTAIVATATINSPAGDPAVMNSSHRVDITAAAAPTTLRISSVRVRVASKSVSAVNVNLDTDDIDDEISDHVVGGGFLFDIANPFGITGTMTLTITAPGGAPIVKNVAIAATATSTTEVNFTEAELQRIIGNSGVTMSLSGTVSGTGASNGVDVSPGQRLTLATRVRMTIRLGN